MLARGVLDAESLITHRFPLDRISDGFDAALNKGESGALKVLITY
jgi:threonine dehydrogenase-like Zn-dependent dehydrogenase